MLNFEASGGQAQVPSLMALVAVEPSAGDPSAINVLALLNARYTGDFSG